MPQNFCVQRSHFNLKNPFSPVPYYLYCRSLELVLKAFLLANDFSIKKIIDIRHNLKKALKKARKEGLDGFVVITSYHEKEIRKANKYYDEEKGFEYFDGITALRGYQNLPDIHILEQLVLQLVAALKQFCLQA